MSRATHHGWPEANNSQRTMYHPAGTAAMGMVVDSDLRVIGAGRLRVVDASVLPLPIAGHYQAPVYGLAEQAAEIIAGEM